MLKSLHIKNFAIIDEVKLDFSSGLNVMTGETGAGKSILIEALGFALGERATADHVMEGAASAEVAAVFDSAGLPPDICAEFPSAGKVLDIRRVIDAGGKGKAYVNSKPVPVSVLGRIGESLVDFHGQHEHQTLLKASKHMVLLDRFAGLEEQVSGIAALYAERQSLISKIESSLLSAAEKERLLDMYRFQFKEIMEAGLKPEEEGELESRLPVVRNSSKIKTLAYEAAGLLRETDNSVSINLLKAQKNITELCDLVPELAQACELLEQARINSEEVADRMSFYAGSAEADPGEIDAILGRLDKIALLKKKYGPEIKDILARADSLKAKIEDLVNSDQTGQALREQLDSAEKKFMVLSAKLHDKRSASAKKMSSEVLKELKPLGFPEIKFSVSVEHEDGKFSETGSDTVEFLFSSNPGQPLKPLRNIASGGEMSRVMLGLKTVLSCADKIPVLVFDEVDAGIGGVVGRLVGRKLSDIASKRQVLCVTHLAQVAGFAVAHLRVSKFKSESSVSVKIEKLTDEQRVEETARMLGGRHKSSETGIKHARELLSECRV